MQHPKFYDWNLNPTDTTRPRTPAARANRHPQLVNVQRLDGGAVLYVVRFTPPRRTASTSTEPQ